MDMLNNYIILCQFTLIDGLILLRCIFLCKENLHWHEGTILTDDFAGAVFISKFQTVLVQEQGDLCTYFCPLTGLHGILSSTVTLPVYRFSSLFIGKRINMNLICYHKCRIESKTKMSDDLILVRLILILCKEIGCAGKCDLIDIFFNLICRHTKTVINKFQSLLIRIHKYLYLGFIFLRQSVLSHHIQLLQLCDCITSVGDQLTEENIMV